MAPNGDLDRTHRQQAFVDSVLHQVRAEGVFGDLTRMNALLSVAQRYVITDAGWNLLDFATEMRSLTSGNLIFHTLPIKGFATIGGQDANVIDPAYLKALIRGTFYPRPGPPRRHHRGVARRGLAGSRATTVDVLNGGPTTGLAGRVSAALAGAGFRAGRVGNTAARAGTAVSYGAAASAASGQIAALFGATAVASASVPPHHVEVLLGAGATRLHIPASAAPRTPGVLIPTAGPQGGAVTATNGIPCVN